MKKEIYFAFYAIKKNIKSSAELRTSFLTNIIGMAINNTVFIAIWVFFVNSVGVINGWTAADIIGLLGFNALTYGIVFSGTAGLRRMADYVAGGGFDRFMLSPKNLLVRVATAWFNVSAIGDIVFGLACLVIYFVLIKVSILQIVLAGVLVCISVLMFLSAVITVYSVSFLFIDAHSVTNGLFELFMTPSLFEGGAFQGITRFVFTFLIPSLVVASLPVEILKNISFEKLGVILLVAVAWFFLSVKLFNRGVRRYESSNFMTFGS